MGLINKLKKKVLDAMEKGAAKNMTGASKEAYEKDQALKAESKASDELKRQSVKQISLRFTKEETKDLESLLMKAGALDDKKLWVAGYLNMRQRQNASFANMFSGIKNYKFLTFNNEGVYVLGIKDDVLSSLKEYHIDDVVSVEVKKSLTKSSIRVTFNDKFSYSVDIAENQNRADEIKRKFK